MKRMTMLLCTFCVVFIYTLTPSVNAQEAIPAKIQVVTVTVKPDAVNAFEEYVKKLMEAGRQTKAPQVVYGFQNARGGPGNTYQFVLPFTKWGELDTWAQIPDMLNGAYGEKEARKILESGVASIIKTESVISMNMPNHSTTSNNPPGTIYPFYVVVNTQIKPAMNADYERFLMKSKEANEKTSGSPTLTRRTTILGDSFGYSTAVGFNKHEDIDRWIAADPPLQKVFGEEEAKRLDQQMRHCVQSQTVSIVAYRPDLSRPPTGN